MDKVYNLLYRLQPYLLGAACFLLLLSVAVKFDSSSTELIWRDRPLLAILMLALGLACMLLYIQLDKANMLRLSRQIKDQDTKRNLYFGLSIFCFGLCFAFRFDDSGATWLWEGTTLVPVVAGAVSVIFLALFFGENADEVV